MATSRRARFARLLAGIVIVAATGYTASFPVAAASPRQEQEPVDDVIPTTTTEPAPDAEQGIIPEPNSGREPEEAGDRGGALQLLVLFALVAALVLGVLLIIRESRRNLARRQAGP